MLGVGGWFWVLGLVLGLLFRCSISGDFLGRWVRCFLGSFLARVVGAAWRLVFAPLQGSVFCVLRSVEFCCRALFLMALPGGMALCYRALFFTFCVRGNSVTGLCFGPIRCSAGLLRPRVFWLGFWARWGARFLLDFFVPGVARPWRRAASRWVCGWATARVVRGRGVAAILRGVCRCACRAVARGCAWRGRFAFSTGRGAGAARLVARVFASLRFEKKLFF